MFLETQADLKKYVTVSNELQIESITPLKNDAIEKYFLRWIPQSLVDIIEGYKANADAVKKKGFDLFENALAKLSLNEFLTIGQLKIQSGSISRVESEKTKTAYKNQITESKEQLLDNGFDLIESLMDHMNANAASFAGWSTSNFKKQSDLLLIKTAREFNDFENLYRKNTTFFSMISNQKTCIDLYLKSRFGETLIDEMIANAALNPIKTKFKTYLQKALANYTILNAAEKKIVNFSADGIRVLQHDKDTASKIESKADLEAISSFMRTYEDAGKRYIDLAYSYMYENKSTFGITDDKPTFTKTTAWV